MPEDFLERLREVVGDRELGGIKSLDVTDDLQLERAAELLRRRFRTMHDVRAYELLVDLAADRLMVLAVRIARDLGLAVDPEELIIAYFEFLFADVAPDGTSHDGARFLLHADAWMRECAEARVRDIALSEATDPVGPVHWGDDALPRESPGPEAALERATHVCFHRLDLPLRRVLRAHQVEGLTAPQIAHEFDMKEREVDELLLDAAERLDRAVRQELEGGAR